MGWPGAGVHLGTGVALPTNPTSTFSCLSTHLLISPSTHLRHLSSANNPPQQRGASGPRAFAAVCAFPGVEMWFPGPWLLHYSPPQSLSVLIHCQHLTPGLGSMALVGPSVHIQFSLTSLSFYLGRKPQSAGPALTQYTHSYAQR